MCDTNIFELLEMTVDAFCESQDGLFEMRESSLEGLERDCEILDTLMAEYEGACEEVTVSEDRADIWITCIFPEMSLEGEYQKLFFSLMSDVTNFIVSSEAPGMPAIRLEFVFSDRLEARNRRNDNETTGGAQ